MEALKLTLEQSLRAKEIGFDAPCHDCFFQGKRHPIWQIEEIYTNPEYVLAPEVWLFLKWAREKHYMVGIVFPNPQMGNAGKWSFSIEYTEKGSWGASSGIEGMFKTYEEAEMKLIDEILNWIKP